MKSTKRSSGFLCPRITVRCFSRFVTIFLITILVMSCSDDDSRGTLAILSDTISFPNQVEQSLPIPKGAQLRSHFSTKGNYLVIISFSASYSETIHTLPQRLQEYGWEIYDEKTVNNDENKETVWRIRGHNLHGSVKTAVFSNQEGTIKTIEYFIKETS